ncbi:MAG TPA: hypothetical protein VMV71_03910 [Candidatus Paceibacterota bacterium]|nr:hypothetical protein [Candidatus Paceibacterota bacterium]
MNPQDLKRLIAGFLAFSVITSVLTLVSFNFVGKTNPQQEALKVEGENPLSTVSKNAFVEKLPSDAQQTSASMTAQSAYAGTSADSSNLTQNFARTLAEQVLANNPNGPQPDANGDPTLLNMPTENYAATLIQQALATTTINIGEKIQNSDLKIENTYGPEDVNAYFDAVNKILVDVASSTNSLNINSQSFSPELLSLSQLAFGAAEQKLKAVPVPRLLLNLHKSLVGFFASQSSILQIASNYQTDPIKSILVLKNSDGIINGDISNFKNEFQKVKPELVSYQYPEGKSLSLFENILGVKTAYAILPVTDVGLIFTTIANWAKNFISKAADWAYNTALQVAINIAINELQNEVVNWIAGNGNPLFITDWNGFLNDVANKAAGQAISQLIPQACSGFGPLLKVALLPVPYADTNVRCTLDQVVNNTNAFFNSFRQGTWYQTWTAYGAVIQPTNNLFGQVILGNDIVTSKAIAAQQAANSNAIASKGFLSVQKCVGYNDAGACDSYVDTTPGAVVADSLSKSLDWQPNAIINAKTFSTFVTTIVNAAVNRVVKYGLSSLTAAANPTPPSSYANATPSGVISPSTNNVSYAISSLEQTGVFQQNQDIITNDTQWLAYGSSTLNLLNQLANSCSNSSYNSFTGYPMNNSNVLQRINDVNALASTTTAELNKANDLAAMKTTALNATSSQDIANIFNQIQGLDINQITAAATAASDRLTALEYFGSLVQNSIANGDCGTGLPPPTTMPPPPTVSGG